MSQIALIDGSTLLYWSGLVLLLALLAACLAMLGCRFLQKKRPLDMALYLPLSLFLGFLAARYLHYHCFYRQYTGLAQAFSDFSVGSFLLPGAMAGALLAALLLRVCGIVKKLPAFLDAAAPGAALGIAVGKLSAAFYSGGRGKVTVTDERFFGLPWSTDMYPLTGIREYRTAVFFWEAVLAFAVFTLLLVLFLRLRNRPVYEDGTVFWLFLLLWNAPEILFDSMRYDSAFFRFNGFVSVVQILSVLVLAAEVAVFSRKLSRRAGHAGPLLIALGVFFLSVSIIGLSEYLVQRHGDRHLSCYLTMTAGVLLSMIGGTALILRAQKAGSPGTEECPNAESKAAKAASAPRGRRAAGAELPHSGNAASVSAVPEACESEKLPASETGVPESSGPDPLFDTTSLSKFYLDFLNSDEDTLPEFPDESFLPDGRE